MAGMISQLSSKGHLFGKLNSIGISLMNPSNANQCILVQIQSLHVTPSMNIGNRKGKKVRNISERKLKQLKSTDFVSPYWRQPDVVPTSPLTRTEHPQDRFAEENDRLQQAVSKAAEDNMPINTLCGETELNYDPYKKEPIRCILCPRRYSVDYIKPDYKNPKLLAQFVSPHTGLVYKKHITGLCQDMQDKVEMEVKRAQSAGFMSTKIKEIQYLKDPQLFDPARPTRKNPY